MKNKKLKQYHYQEENYDTTLKNGTELKITVIGEVDNYDDEDFDEMLTKFATSTRDSYLKLGEDIRSQIGRPENYFYVFKKLGRMRIESVSGTKSERVNGMIKAGWIMDGIYSENMLQFMVNGKTTTVLDKSFKEEKPQKDNCDTS